MKVLNYFDCSDREYWLEEIGKSDWGAGKYLYTLLKENRLHEIAGEGARVLMLTEGTELISFCTLAERDEIQPIELSPWIGFVYTFPARRGQRCVGRLFDRIAEISKEENFPRVYLSTDHVGLYEKYGCKFYGEMKTVGGEMSRVYIKTFE